MREHLNTLYVTLEGAWLAKDGQAVDVRHEHESKLRVPLHNLEGIVCLGWDIGASAQLMAACAEAGVTLSFCTPHGKFLVAATGFIPGNVLLRREQFRRADDPVHAVAIARNMVAAKIANSRVSLRRALRNRPDQPEAPRLRAAESWLGQRLGAALREPSREGLRGIEGDAAATYFEVFPVLLTHGNPALGMSGRSRRPPLDPVNALLSFLCRAGCRGGFSALRPARTAFAGAGFDGGVSPGAGGSSRAGDAQPSATRRGRFREAREWSGVIARKFA